jgi:hypothetical protein
LHRVREEHENQAVSALLSDVPLERAGYGDSHDVALPFGVSTMAIRE